MSDPVTILVRRGVRPGREKAYEDWLKRLWCQPGPKSTPTSASLLSLLKFHHRAQARTRVGASYQRSVRLTHERD
jgi:hypothetical protein